MSDHSPQNGGSPTHAWPQTTLLAAEQLSLLILDVLELLAPKDAEARADIQAQAKEMMESAPKDQWMRAEALRAIADGKF